MSVCYSICQQPPSSHGPRSKNSPVSCFYGASARRFDSFTPPPLAKQSHVLPAYILFCALTNYYSSIWRRRFFSLLSLIMVPVKRGEKSKLKSRWAKWKNTPAPLWLRHQPSVLQRLWISSLRLKRRYLNILRLFWLFGLEHLLLFGVFILGTTMKQLYHAWRCTRPTHQFDFFFFLAVKTTGVVLPFGVLEVDVN